MAQSHQTMAKPVFGPVFVVAAFFPSIFHKVGPKSELIH